MHSFDYSPRNVVVVDVAYLNGIISDFKHSFERMLGRVLPDMDLVTLLTCVAMDAGMEAGGEGVDVVLVGSPGSAVLEHCSPSRIHEELDGRACGSAVGEMSFMLATTEGFASADAMCGEVALALSAIEGLRRLVLLVGDGAFEPSGLNQEGRKQPLEVVRFVMGDAAWHDGWRTETLAYPMLKAFGVRGEELS